MKKLSSQVQCDQITADIGKMFDYEFSGVSEFTPPRFEVEEDFCIGLIVGPSGSGKSTLLKTMGQTDDPVWSADKSVASHFSSADEAKTKLSAAGFNSVPSWLKPHHVLSTGEKFRANLARQITNGACIDEFTSVVDRNVAKSCAYAISRYAREAGLKKVTFASCHYDIIEWLQPDWVFDTKLGAMLPRGSLRLPDRTLVISPCDPSVWSMFRDHHYLTGNINKSSRCWIAKWNGTVVGFASALAFPNGNFKNAWREHRTVVLPDFQGLGFGVRISDAVAQIFINEGCRYFSKTVHPRMGEYRNNSPLWNPTSKNMRDRQDYASGRKTKESAYKHLHQNRAAYSHEFIGKIES